MIQQTENRVREIETVSAVRSKPLQLNEIEILSGCLMQRLGASSKDLDYSFDGIKRLDKLLVQYQHNLKGPATFSDKEFYNFVCEQVAYYGESAVRTFDGIWYADVPLSRVLVGVTKTKSGKGLNPQMYRYISPLNHISVNWDRIQSSEKSALSQLFHRLVKRTPRKVSVVNLS